MIYVALLCAATFAAPTEFTTGEATLVADGFQFTEGPLWLPHGVLLFSDIPADTIYRSDKTVFRRPSGESNGLTLDLQGRLIACEHKTRRVTRTEKDNTITVLAERFEGKRFNSPNDVIVRSDGAIVFTDPPYGLQGGLEGPHAELAFSGVYMIEPDGDIRLLIQDFQKPNGLAFSPDERILYIADTEKNHLRAFDSIADDALSEGRVFCALPSPDGLKVDREGNVWATASDGVRVYAPSGELQTIIPFPAAPANLTFGDEHGRTLYVTARSGVYKIQTQIAGIHPAKAMK